jgi:hypothetical protein
MIFSKFLLQFGDAAVAGQGILYEIVQMAQLDGYRWYKFILYQQPLVLQQIT